MVEIIKNKEYIEDISTLIPPSIKEKIKNKSFLISGACGMIGSTMIDALLADPSLGVRIYAVGRNTQKARDRFSYLWDDGRFTFFEKDINEPIDLPVDSLDYIVHAASNTHPRVYSSDPIGTIWTNVTGTGNLLEFGCSKDIERFIFLSSVEIYGENRGDVQKFSEDYLGYIDCNTMRAGYPESKRVGEALCQAYIAQKGMDIVIPRLSRVYGPTLLKTDSKALTQFIRKCVDGEDIVLKSEGNQLYSYTYVTDAVRGILYCLAFGDKGSAYNVADPGSDITLKDLAGILAGMNGKEVVFEIPDEAERKGYSTATKALLDPSGLNALGFVPRHSIREGLEMTVRILGGE